MWGVETGTSVTSMTPHVEQATEALAGLLARARECNRRAEVERDTAVEALHRAREVEVLARASVLLDDLAQTGHRPLVEDFDEVDGVAPLDVAGHLAAAEQEYLRAHHFARGWLSANPQIAQQTLPPGPVFDTRLEADTALIAVPYDLEGRHDLTPDDLYAISTSALGYQPGHGWYLRVSESELELIIAQQGEASEPTTSANRDALQFR